MRNSFNDEISDEQDAKNMARLRSKIIGTGKIILINYRICLENNGTQHYYNSYIEKCKKKHGIPGCLEDFEKDLDSMVKKYCEHLINGEKTILEIKERNLIYLVYQDLIDDSAKMGNDKIINKL